MKQQAYQSSIISKSTPHEATDKISRVSEWWGTNFEGESQKINDAFIVRFRNGDMYKMKVSEIIPDEKIVWDVIDSDQTWHEDRDEWTGTKIVWEIIPQKDGSKVIMTHVGLVPAFECYTSCKKGWDYLLQKSLFKFMSENKGLPV